MTIIDSQVHAYEANTPQRPWHSVPNWPPHVTGDEMVAAMDKVGVDGAIFISAFSLYRYDASYAVEVQKAHSDRMAIVKPVDPDDPAVADVIADWKRTPGAVGIRIVLAKDLGGERDPNDPGLDRIARAAVAHDFPVNLLCWGNLEAGSALVDRHPDTRFIIDHMGIIQPSTPPAPPQPWADLPKVLELAKRKNSVIKVSGACTLSKEPYPVRRHLGSARSRVRRLGFRPLPVGHGLDTRLRRRQLRAGGRAFPQDRSPDRQRASDADGRRLRQGLSVVTEETVSSISTSEKDLAS
jgi:L-fuconolactonase